MLWLWWLLGYIVSVVLSWLMFRKSIKLSGYNDFAQVVVTFIPFINLISSFVFFIQAVIDYSEYDNKRFFKMK